MTPLPDRIRPRLSPPARALAAYVLHATAFAAWRAAHPAARERFLEAPRPAPATRLYYEADDGWRAPLFHLPPRAGGSGEPVVLAHALGLGGDVFRYGRGATLAGRLRKSGFSVYLLHHRGDRVAIAPRRRAGFDFDDILERDLPAALERVRLHARCEQVHWVGHGLGGQLGLAFAGRYPGADLASVVALCAAVRFALPSSETRRIALSRALLPSWWHLPTRAMASCAAPWIAEPGVGPRLRGVLRYAAEDVPIGLLRHAGRWLREGSLVDRTGLLDYRIAFADAEVPLLAITAGGDRVCPEGAGAAALETWGCADKARIALPEAWGHLDVLLSQEADEQVFRPLARWLSDRRQRAWDAPRLATSGR